MFTNGLRDLFVSKDPLSGGFLVASTYEEIKPILKDTGGKYVGRYSQDRDDCSSYQKGDDMS